MSNEQKYFSLKDLSKQIGLSSRTLRAWVQDAATPLPCFRVGGKLLFKASDVEKWIEQFRVQTPNIDELADAIIKNIKGGENRT